MGTHLQPYNASNYTIGGTRAWFNRDVDLTLTPARREGFKDLGNVVDAPQEQEIDELEHYTARSGTRRRDRLLVREISEEIVLTLDEPNYENLRTFFRGGDVTDVAASSGNSVSDEVVQLVDLETRILYKGYNASSIVVKDITDVTTYVKDTDYEEVDVIGDWKGIKIKSGGAITSGDFLRVSYDYDVRAHKRFAPATDLEVKGQFLLFGVSDTGNEFIRSFEQVQIQPEGAFDFDDEDWTNFQLRVIVIDDTDNSPNFPFGIFEHYGTGEDL